MLNSKKRNSIIISMLCLLVLSLLACFGCDQSNDTEEPPKENLKNPSYVNFEDCSIDVERDSFFKLDSYLTVKDVNGKSHLAEAQVKDGDGEIVAYEKDELTIQDEEKYVVSLRVVDGKTLLAERLLTLNVVENLSPSIELGAMPAVGEQGKTYAVPVTTPTNSKTTLSVYWVSFLADAEDVSVETSKFSFYAERAGKYKLVVDCVDQEKHSQKTATFLVKAPVYDYTCLNFDDYLSMDSVLNANKSWREEFNGRNGVVLINNPAEEAYSFTFAKTKEELKAFEEEWDMLSVWTYVNESGSFKASLCAENDAFTQTIVGKRWQELQITKAQLIESYATLENFYSKYARSSSATLERNAFLRIESLDGTPVSALVGFDCIELNQAFEADIEVTSSYGEALLQNYALTVTVNVSAIANAVMGEDYALFVTDPYGESVAHENGVFTPKRVGEYLLTVKLLKGHASDVTKTVEVRVLREFVLSSDLLTGKPNEEYAVPKASLTLNGEEESQAVVTAKVEDEEGNSIALNDGKFVMGEAGSKYKIRYECFFDGILYTNSVTVACIAQENALVDGLNVTLYGAQESEWIEEKVFGKSESVLKFGNIAAETLSLTATDANFYASDVETAVDTVRFIVKVTADNPVAATLFNGSAWNIPNGKYVMIDVSLQEYASYETQLSEGSAPWLTVACANVELTEFYFHTIKLAKGNPTAELVMDGGESLDRLTASNGVIVSYVNEQTKTPEMPNIPTDFSGYYVFDNTTAKGRTVNVSCLPSVGYNDFANADYMEMQIYSTAHFSIRFGNFTIRDITVVNNRDAWKTVRIPTSIWRNAANGVYTFENQRELFNRYYTDTELFTLWDETNYNAAPYDNDEPYVYKFYITNVRLGYTASVTKDDTVVAFNTSNVRNPYNHINYTNGEHFADGIDVDGISALKVKPKSSEAGNAGSLGMNVLEWSKSYRQIESYSKFKLTIFIDDLGGRNENAKVGSYIYDQVPGYSGNNSTKYYWTKESGSTNLTVGAWQEVYLDKEYVLSLYANAYTNIYTYFLEITVENKTDFTVYLASIEGIK